MQQSIQVVFSDLYWAKRGVPFTSLPLASERPYIFHDHIGEWEHLFQLSNDARFRFPSATSRGWNPILAVETIAKPLGSTPLSPAPCTSHRASHLYRIFHMVRCLDHQIEHRVFCPNDTKALKPTAWIDTSYQWLIIRLLFVAQLHVE